MQVSEQFQKLMMEGSASGAQERIQNSGVVQICVAFWRAC